MKMIKSAYLLIGFVALCVACNKSGEEKVTKNGFKFQLVEKGDGIVPKAEQLLVFHYKVKNSKDSVWVNTYENGIPEAIPIGDTSTIAQEPGMIQAFRMLSVGDSVHVTLPTNQFFQKIYGRPAIPGIDTTLSMSIDIRVTNIMDRQKFAEFREDLFKKRAKSQKVKEAKVIDEYLTKNNIKAETDTSGIRYVIHNNAGGKKPASTSDCVEVKYHGKFMKDEKTFDQSDKMAFPLNRVIPGWTISVPKLGIGDSATFYIPSSLAYGPEGYPGAIPPDAILIFDVTLLNTAAGFDDQNRICK